MKTYKFYLTLFWSVSLKPLLIMTGLLVYLIFSISCVFAPFIGICLLVDYYNNWFWLLFIPYILVFPVLHKPIEFIFKSKDES